MSLILSCPCVWVQPTCILTRRILLQTTLAISNVPGPTEPVTFGGNPIVGIYPIVSGHPQVSCLFQSYHAHLLSLNNTWCPLLPASIFH